MARKILIIDDEPELVAVVNAILRSHGYIPLSAEDGHTGIDLAAKEQPDLIICDVNMPYDGYATLKDLQQNPKTAHIPFMFLSGMMSRNNVRRGMELGADDYLSKPFTASELIAAINTRLAKKQETEKRINEKVNEIRGGLTMALPHELCTPLSGILGLTEFLIEDYQTIAPNDILQTAQDIQKSALRLKRLVENFLIYAQLESLKTDDPRVNIFESGVAAPSMAEVVVQEAASEVAREFGRESDLRCSMTRCVVPVLSMNLKKIVEELASNAFKFSESGTVVHVSTYVVNGSLELAVTNTGIGMSQDEISRIGPHVQFNRQVQEQQGAGLGLAIVQKLVELHKARMNVESIPDVTTTFRVVFPLANRLSGASYPG